MTLDVWYYSFSAADSASRTDNMITRLTRITWLTALPPTICAILHLAAYMELAPSGDSMFIVFSFWAPKLYVVTSTHLG